MLNDNHKKRGKRKENEFVGLLVLVLCLIFSTDKNYLDELRPGILGPVLGSAIARIKITKMN
jgi:hypothetical protein